MDSEKMAGNRYLIGIVENLATRHTEPVAKAENNFKESHIPSKSISLPNTPKLPIPPKMSAGAFSFPYFFNIP